MPFNFSWIREGELAASARPAGIGELMELRDEGVRAVVSLTEAPLKQSELDEIGLVGLHIPVVDFTAPDLHQLRAFAEFMEEQRSIGHAVLVHCTAGLGRSGTVAACHLVSTGMEAGEAITAIRRLRPGSIETSDQEQVVHAWAEHVRTRSSESE